MFLFSPLPIVHAPIFMPPNVGELKVWGWGLGVKSLAWEGWWVRDIGLASLTSGGGHTHCATGREGERKPALSLRIGREAWGPATAAQRPGGIRMSREGQYLCIGHKAFTFSSSYLENVVRIAYGIMCGTQNRPRRSHVLGMRTIPSKGWIFPQVHLLKNHGILCVAGTWAAGDSSRLWNRRCVQKAVLWIVIPRF